MAWSRVDTDILLLLMITMNAAVSVLSRNSSQNDLSLTPQDHQISQSQDNDVQKGCPNWQGMLVADGEKYVPNGNDMCTQCTCDRRFPIMCHSVACSPPLQCASPQQVKEACCEYICLDDRAPRDRNVTDITGGTEKEDGENITNLSLRLIASTVTSFLVLALLLFMVHRLRQRRLLLAMRRFESQSRQVHTDDTDSDPYIPNSFLSLECPPYTDPPPPYSPPKPPQIMPGEQPPPYDEINHNIDETNADENRNQIRGVTSTSGFGRGVQDTAAGPRRTGSRGHIQAENDAACHSDHHHRSCELEQQRSGSDNLRLQNTLPAYASTDVVEGLGVVISPGSDIVCYNNSGWNNWLGAHSGHERHVAPTETIQQRSPPRSNFSASCAPSISRIQTMPTTTAFQRFSNIFRRDSWKIKNLRHHSRSLSDYNAPPHYATVPRNEQSPRSRVDSYHPQARRKSTSRPYSNGFPDTLYLSYDAGQATYTLGAISPSTSSSNSSEHYDQNTTTCTTAGSTTTNTTPGASSSGNSASPPEGSCSIAENFLISPVHRQQFHEDLCRHLPPLQLSDNHVLSTHDLVDRTCISAPKSTFTNGVSNNNVPSQCSRNEIADLSIQRMSGHTFMGSAHAPNLSNLRPAPCALTSITSVSLLSSSTDQHNTAHQQQSLASFIRSHTSAMDSRDLTSSRGVAPAIDNRDHTSAMDSRDRTSRGVGSTMGSRDHTSAMDSKDRTSAVDSRDRTTSRAVGLTVDNREHTSAMDSRDRSSSRGIGSTMDSRDRTSRGVGSTMDNRDQTTGRAGATQHSLIKSNCPVVLPSARESPQLLSSSSVQTCSNYLPTFPQVSSSVLQRSENSNETIVEEIRNDQELASQTTRNKQETVAATRETRKSPEIGTKPGYVLALAQGFQMSCRTISPFSCPLPPLMAALVDSSITTSPSSNILAPLISTLICTSTSSSPSPPPASTASVGVLRRSQSGASQTSMFSVCSETGEKKLKTGDLFESDTRVISSDSCCSEHHSLSGSGHFCCQESQSVPGVTSLPPLTDIPAVCPSEILSSNLIGYSDVWESMHQPNTDLRQLYSHKEISLPSEGSNTVSSELVTASHPLTACSRSSLLSSSGDGLTDPASGHHQNEDHWNNSLYNFNSLTEINKSTAVKDVPFLCQRDQMTQSVNIPPLPPFTSDQSNKILQHSLPSYDDPSILSKSGKPYDGLKKIKKKRTKDRNVQSQQFCNTVRHSSPSPKHQFLKVGESNKDLGGPQKSECALKDKEVIVRPLRPTDKKHRAHPNMTRQHARLSDSLNCNKIMTRSAGDSAAVYGNADVYRSIGGEGTAVSYQHQTFGSWNQQCASGGCDHSFNVPAVINDLNQPPNYLKSQTDNSSPSHVVGGSDGPVTGKADPRKKTSHRRQSSTGDRAGHTPSPNRYKSRPKSLAAPDTHLNDKRVEANIPRPSLTTCDFGLVGKGARSGFGHDLNFDDQSGIADLHIHESEFGSRRVSVGQDSHLQSNLGPVRKLSRAEGTCEPCSNSKMGSASYNYHPGSRSGLSNELSFTSRPTLAGNNNKKRQSLPTGVGGTSFLGVQDRGGLSSSITARSRQGEGEGHIQVGQVRGDRSACQSERRVEKPVFLEGCVEATSYV